MKKASVFVCLILACCHPEEKISISTKSIGTNISEVQDSIRVNYYDKIPLIKRFNSDYKAYCYKEFLLDELSVKLTLISKQAFGTVHLLSTLNTDGEIYSFILAGDTCSGVGESDLKDTVFWCGDSFSDFTSKDMFVKTEVRKSSSNYFCSPFFIDTIKYQYRIRKNGKCEFLKIDSVRVTKYLDKQGNILDKKSCEF